MSAPTTPPPTWPTTRGAADLAAGADSILLAPTNDVINALNARARTDRLAADPAAAGAPTVVLADQLTASVGDTIRTRKNARWIPIGRNDFVRNGYRYTITEVTDRWQPQSPPSAQRAHRHACPPTTSPST